MSNIFIKSTIVAILTVTLFGCGGEADEAKKLGFSSVEEMKEAHAKGWHTQQQYYKDNPAIAIKNAAAASAPVAADGYKDWKDFQFSDGKFVIKYPPKNAHPIQASENNSEFDCEVSGRTTVCRFMLANMNLLTVISGKSSKGAAANVEEFVNGLTAKISERREINVNGLALTELITTEKEPGDGATRRNYIRVYSDGSAIVMISGSALDKEFSKADVETFLNSLSLTKSYMSSVDSASTKLAQKWQKDIQYMYTADGSCTSDATTKCINLTEYKEACEENEGLSKSALSSVAVISSSDDKKLIQNGRLGDLSVTWSSSNRCNVSFSASGIVDGNSKKSSFTGKVIAFSVDPSNGSLLIGSVDIGH